MAGRFTVIPIMVGLAIPYLVTVLLYLSQTYPDQWLPETPWGLVAGKAFLAVAGPVSLALVWRRFQAPRLGIWAYDWVGGWMVAYAMGWIGAIGQDLMDRTSLDPTGRLILVWAAVSWVLVGTALLVSGALTLTGLMNSERSERKRLEALISFTQQITSMDFQTTLDSAVRELYHLLDADACVLYLWNDQDQVLIPVAGIHSESVYTKEYIDRMMAFRCPKGHGLTGAVMESGEPYISSDVSTDPRTTSMPGYGEGHKSSILAPLLLEGRRLGVVRLTRRGINQFTKDDLDLTLSFAGQAALMIEHGRVLQELASLSMTDALTGLFNARQFHRILEREASLAQRHQQPLSLVMIDSDSLKQMNDRLGHQTGDLYLKQIAQVIRETIRRTDFAFRYAGDEFLLILPQTEPEMALTVAERIRQGVERMRLSPVVAGTISLGVATLLIHATTPEGLLAAADDAMYQSKRAGKNRTTLASSSALNASR